MKKAFILTAFICGITILILSFREKGTIPAYRSVYIERLNGFRQQLSGLLETIEHSDCSKPADLQIIQSRINDARLQLKATDFWLRYFEPTVYKKINGPLPVEWETEVFEKFEKPYKREGAGLTLAALYMEEENFSKDSLRQLVNAALNAMNTYAADSITQNIRSYQHFYLCNRLYLLNLSAIYTTAFECPDTTRVIPELRFMMKTTAGIYESFNNSFPNQALDATYLSLYNKALVFVEEQPDEFSSFDHFSFIKDYINPLFSLNQSAIRNYNIRSTNFVDYSLNKTAASIFDKDIYSGLNPKGIFLRVDDPKELEEIDRVGKQLFYDPILSGNNKRSCASCHKASEYFTDTAIVAAQRFDEKGMLPRNTPSLVNTIYNHLAMLDGRHISLQDQVREVIAKPEEMGSNQNEVLQKVLSCSDYKKTFTRLLKLTPQEDEITIEHIISTITFYYSKFSRYYSPFDEAMDLKGTLSPAAKEGFNLFMSKSQCATCHFVPQFNGVKPPFIGSEFEVLGVPSDTSFHQLSMDKGRYDVNPAEETLHAFRTGSLRNIMHTAPYMHNGVFKTINEVIDFYDAGGGTGKGLLVNNQTLGADSLRLSKTEKESLVAFLRSLDEKIVFDGVPGKLPLSKDKKLNGRKAGGEY